VDIDKFDTDVSKEEARRMLNLNIDGKIVVYAGHLYPWKGVYILIEASKFLDATVVLVGGLEEDVNKVKRYIKSNKIDNVHVVGHVEPSKVPLYLKAADVLVLPNSAQDKRSVYYTSPLKLFEYMASRRPIVASDLPSIREVLDESCAIFVTPDDPKSLSYGIKKVFKDVELADRIADLAYNEVKFYSWISRAKKILYMIKKGG